MPSSEHRVVVCGAGFAGIGVAKRLEPRLDVTLVAPTDKFVYLPLIHEVLSENVLPREVSRPLAEVLPRTRLVYGRAAGVEGNDLITADGARHPFDTLVVAIGAEPNDFGVPGVSEHALPFYSVGDALRANATLKHRATEATGRPLRVVVVGASFTGVEVAGEVAVLLDKLDVPRDIVLLDASPGIFPRQSQAFRDGVTEGLKRLGLEVRDGRPVREVRADGVVVDAGGGRTELLPADVVFWCAGAKPRAIGGVDPRVRRTLQSVARDDVYVIGDAAQFPRELAVPKLGQTAEDQARLTARNILGPGHVQPYEPRVKGLIVSIGHGFAVAELASGAVFTGTVPWHVKRQLYKAKIMLA